MILGTAAYMSPEQARGKAGRQARRHLGVWLVLYEMLTGARLFAGDSIPETLGLIFSREPDLASAASGDPPHVSTLIARCLVKDPRQRLRDIGDARLELDGVGDIDGRPLPHRTQALARIALGSHTGTGAAGWLDAVGREPRRHDRA